MVRTASVPQAHSHHTLVTDAWAGDVQALERGIGEFPAPPVSAYHVSLFELPGDPHLHVNVTHKEPTRGAKGWLGPGVLADGFIYSRTFDSAPTAAILRSIRQMVFAARA